MPAVSLQPSFVYADLRRRLPSNKATPPIASNESDTGSGVVTAIPTGPSNPVINEALEALTVPPEDIVYSPTVLLPKFATNRSEPETANSYGLEDDPKLINEALTTDPLVVYSPIELPLWFTTNRSEPITAIP